MVPQTTKSLAQGAEGQRQKQIDAYSKNRSNNKRQMDDIHHAQALANGTSWGALRFSRDQGQGLRSNLSSQLEFSSARSRQRGLAADKSPYA